MTAEEILFEAEMTMEKSVDYMIHEFSAVRTGKASPALVENVDGKIIRLPIPALTEERRKELVKGIKQMAEESRVRIRSARRDGLEELKKAEKGGGITEDEVERY